MTAESITAASGPLSAFGSGRFYRDYWQQQPLFLPQALPGLHSPLSAEELAGLACEEGVDSRLITGTWEAANFTLQHGPIDEALFPQLGERDWTLLVQDVDKFYPPAAELLARFDFLPAWRVDDLMISFAASGGSVGPHTDEYDVFLVQLEGRRRWQIAQQFDSHWLPGQELKVLRHFEPEQEWICEPGDILYLPPNVAHYGVALEPGLTASVGLRAPSLNDLLDDLADHWPMDLIPRYRDPGIQTPDDRWQIDDTAVTRFRTLLRQLSEASEAPFKRWLGGAISAYRLASQWLEEPQQYDIEPLIADNAPLYRQSASRLFWMPYQDQALLCANGSTYPLNRLLAQTICQQTLLHCAALADPDLIRFLLDNAAFTLAAAPVEPGLA